VEWVRVFGEATRRTSSRAESRETNLPPKTAYSKARKRERGGPVSD